MKKVFVLGVIMCLLLTINSGCSRNSETDAQATTKVSVSSSTKSEPVKITYWYWEDTEGKHQEMLADKWAKYTDKITLDLEPIPSSSFHDKLLTAVSSGTAPDVFITYPSWIPELVGLQGLADLTGKFDSWEYIDEVPDNMLKLAYAGYDKLYTFPRSALTMYLYCRTDYFKEAGLDYPKTMDDFYKACEKLTKDTNGDGKTDVYGFGMRGAKGGQSMWSSMVLNALPDWNYFDANGKAQLVKDELIKANQKYIDIFKNGWAPPTAPTDGFNEILQNFKAGVTAMMYHHVGSSKAIVDTLGADKVVAVPMPAGVGGQFGVLEVTNLGVYSGSKNIDAATEFIKWISTPEMQDTICTELKQVPWVKSVAAMDKYQKDVFFKTSADSLTFSKALPIKSTMSSFTEEVWPQTFQRALLGEITSEKMMEILNDSLDGKQ